MSVPVARLNLYRSEAARQGLEFAPRTAQPSLTERSVRLRDPVPRWPVLNGLGPPASHCSFIEVTLVARRVMFRRTDDVALEGPRRSSPTQARTPRNRKSWAAGTWG